MNHPHESQAAAMARTGELPDGEQLRECINSGQASAAQVVAHAEAGELSRPVAHRFDIMEGIESKVGSWLYSDGPPKESPFASMQALFTEEQMRAALAAERAEVARLTAENESLRESLTFVERWANHHGQKAHMTPQDALSCIQHYPPILAITKSYADGEVPETYNPYAEVARLREALGNLLHIIDEVRGVDAEPVGYICPARLKNLQAGHELSIPLVHKSEALLGGGTGYLQDIPVYTLPAPSQPAATTDLVAETPTQKGMRATLAVQAFGKAFEGLGAGRKDRKMKVTDEMVNRFLMWKLPADFAPDCGISFKSESDYEHPVFGRSKHEPMGTNLFSADQARAMLEHVLADIQPAAPVELPVVAEVVLVDQGVKRGLQVGMLTTLKVGDKLVKLSDAQVAIAAGRKAS